MHGTTIKISTNLSLFLSNGTCRINHFVLLLLVLHCS